MQDMPFVIQNDGEPAITFLKELNSWRLVEDTAGPAAWGWEGRDVYWSETWKEYFIAPKDQRGLTDEFIEPLVGPPGPDNRNYQIFRRAADPELRHDCEQYPTELDFLRKHVLISPQCWEHMPNNALWARGGATTTSEERQKSDIGTRMRDAIGFPLDELDWSKMPEKARAHFLRRFDVTWSTPKGKGKGHLKGKKLAKGHLARSIYVGGPYVKSREFDEKVYNEYKTQTDTDHWTWRTSDEVEAQDNETPVTQRTGDPTTKYSPLEADN